MGPPALVEAIERLDSSVRGACLARGVRLPNAGHPTDAPGTPTPSAMTSTKSCIELSEYPRPASLSYQEDDSQYHTEPIAELPPNVFDSAPSSTSRARRPSNQLPAPDHDDIQLNPFSSRARRPSSSLFNSSRKSSEFLPEESEHPPSLSPSSSLPVPAALQERSQQQQLKPIDRGRTANLFLFAALVAELTVWGMPFSVSC
jgi:hypothetical protein